MGDAAAEKRRAEWGYEANTPRCCTCVKYRKPRMNDNRLQPAFCAGGKFAVEAQGCCDRWKSRTGERLIPG